MTFPVKPQKGQPVRAELIGQIIDCLRMFRPLPGRNILTQCTPGGTIINGTPGGAASADVRLHWAMRFHRTDDDTTGQWEIWLPPGCMAVGDSLQNLNPAASDTSGHDDDEDGWRILPIDEQHGQPTIDKTEGEGADAVRTVARKWLVVAHAKTAARLDGVDAIDKPAKRYLFVATKKILTAQEEQQQTDEERADDAWGDEFAQTVGRIEVGTVTKGGTTTVYRKATQYARAPLSVQGGPRTGFDLEWTFGFDADGWLEVKHVYCVRPTLAAAGITLNGPAMTEVTGAQSSIYAKIKTNPLDTNSNSGSVEVVIDPSDMRTDDDLTWLRLYDMAYNAVKDDCDYRAQSLANIQVYR